MSARARPPEESRRRFEAAGVDRDRLHDHAGDRRVQRALERLGIAPVEHDDVGQRRGILSAGRRTVVARRGRDVDRVGPAVVVVAELDDREPACPGARESKRELAGLGAGRQECGQSGTGHVPRDPLGEVDLGRMRRAAAQAQRHRAVDSVANDLRRVAEDQRAVAQRIVDVLVAVDVDHARAFGAGERERDRTLGRPRRGRYAARQHARGPVAMRERAGEGARTGAMCAVERILETGHRDLLGAGAGAIGDRARRPGRRRRPTTASPRRPGRGPPPRAFRP